MSVQVLMGDFNAEPEEVAIKYLLEKDNFNLAAADCPSPAVATDDSSVNTTTACASPLLTPFVDAWQHVQQTKHAQSGKTVLATPSIPREASQQEEEEIIDAGLTFPACNPVKRIDFIMVRNASTVEPHNVSTQVHAEIRDFKIEGIKPTADTGKKNSLNPRAITVTFTNRTVCFELSFCRVLSKLS